MRLLITLVILLITTSSFAAQVLTRGIPRYQGDVAIAAEVVIINNFLSTRTLLEVAVDDGVVLALYNNNTPSPLIKFEAVMLYDDSHTVTQARADLLTDSLVGRTIIKYWFDDGVVYYIYK